MQRWEGKGLTRVGSDTNGSTWACPQCSCLSRAGNPMKTELISATSALAERQVSYTTFPHVWELHPLLQKRHRYLLSNAVFTSFWAYALWLQKEFLAIVTEILIVSICLSGTLSFCLFGRFLFSRSEVEEGIRGEWSCCLRLERCSCPNYRLFLFISPPHPSASAALRISRPGTCP